METDGKGNWLAVWYSQETLGQTIGWDTDILFSRSTDNAETWSDPAPIDANAGNDGAGDFYPHLATDREGNWVVVWYSHSTADDDILFARSTDQGATWSPVAPLHANAGTDSGNDEKPRIATDGESWLVVWESTEPLSDTLGRDRDILISRSTDSGASWTPPRALNTNAPSDSGDDETPVIVTDEAGTWVASWHSADPLGGRVGEDKDILVARSLDRGVTWTAPAPLNANAASDSGHDIAPALATDGAGKWVAVWASADSLGGRIGTDPTSSSPRPPTTGRAGRTRGPSTCARSRTTTKMRFPGS